MILAYAVSPSKTLDLPGLVPGTLELEPLAHSNIVLHLVVIV